MPILELESSFALELPELCVEWSAASFEKPSAVALNEALATELGIDPDLLRSSEGLDILTATTPLPGSRPVAMAYAGHQFGGYSPLLGDGRALLLGEVVGDDGRRRDIHLKGSGRTPFARGGDGKAVLGPMLRELVVSEAMHALGLATTRSLAVVATGEPVRRETIEPGAILVRVASSHIRVGTFEYAARLPGEAGDSPLTRLIDHVIHRHYPELAGSDTPGLDLLGAVVESQARLVAGWMLVGFVHGVMNTDNVAVSGEGIDYGPCAFVDYYDPATVFSSIDHGGRYAFANQPRITHWNLARFAETLLQSIDADTQTAAAAATEVLSTFPERFDHHWSEGMRAKLGLAEARPADEEIFDTLLGMLQSDGVDYTSAFRAVAGALRGDDRPLRSLFADTDALTSWMDRWRSRLDDENRDPLAAAESMDTVNPVHIPRNHLVEEALSAATLGDMAPVEQLLETVRSPFSTRPGLEHYTQPASREFNDGHRTFCGT